MSKIIKIILVSFVIVSCQTTEKWIEISTNVEIKVFSERGLNLGNDYLFKWTPPLKYSDRTSNFDIKPDFTIDGKNLYFTPKISENYLISLEVTNLNDSTIYVENFYYNAIDKGIKMKTISEKTDNYTINENKIERIEINSIDLCSCLSYEIDRSSQSNPLCYDEMYDFLGFGYTELMDIYNAEGDDVGLLMNRRMDRIEELVNKCNINYEQLTAIILSAQNIHKDHNDSDPLDQIISSDNNVRYTIQIVVWKSRKKAIEEKEFLNYNGYDAYIEEIKTSDNEIIFRVRVGSFEDKQKAEEVRDSILEKYPQWENNKLWITKTE